MHQLSSKGFSSCLIPKFALGGAIQIQAAEHSIHPLQKPVV